MFNSLLNARTHTRSRTHTQTHAHIQKLIYNHISEITGSYHKVSRKHGTTPTVEQPVFQELFAQEHTMCYSPSNGRNISDTLNYLFSDRHVITCIIAIHVLSIFILKCPRKRTAPGTSVTVKLKVHCQIYHRRTPFLDTDPHTRAESSTFINTPRNIHYKQIASLNT